MERQMEPAMERRMVCGGTERKTRGNGAPHTERRDGTGNRRARRRSPEGNTPDVGTAFLI